MKYIYKIAILFAVLFAVSCKDDKDDPIVDPDPVEETVSLNLTFVLPSDMEIGKTVWEAGDQIVVHGEYAKDQVTVTLSSGDISGDGKTATLTVNNLKPYKRTDYTSNLYAEYPASAVDNLPHCFFYSKFNNTNAQLLAACNEGNTFNFKNVCGVLSFSVDTEQVDADSYEFYSNKKEPVGYEFLQVKIADGVNNLSQYKGDPVITLNGDLKDVNNICLPDGISLAKGFTMKFKKDGKAIKIVKISDAMTIAAGTVTDLEDITDQIQVYVDPFSDDVLDADADGNANCYIITTPGTYKFKAVVGNNATSYLEDVAGAKIIWETWNGAEEVTPNSVVASVAYAEDYMIFDTPETLHAGNALIAAVDDKDAVLWSWHIWVPETAISTSSYGDIWGAPCMSRDLGALIDTPIAEETVPSTAYGLSYMWGNKNPYPSPSAFNSSSPAKVAGTAPTVAEGKISLAQATADPTLMGSSPNGDWVEPSNNTLWEDTAKSIYDPCPAGYRVPKHNSAKPFMSDNLFNAAGWTANKTYGWFTIGNPAAAFSLGGYRDDYGVGSFTHVYDRVLYWTSFAAPTATGAASGIDIRIGSSAKMKDSNKSRAGYVRCVVEQ